MFEFDKKYIMRWLLLKYQLTSLMFLLYLTSLIKISGCISKEGTYHRISILCPSEYATFISKGEVSKATAIDNETFAPYRYT